MRINNKILFASTNREKFDELSALLKLHAPLDGVELIPVHDVVRNAGTSLGQVEKYETYLENAMAKARLVNQGAHYTTLADDSGLEVLALEGRPGVKSHRFSIPHIGETQDQSNNNLLLKELDGKPNRQARFVCTLVLLIEGIMIKATGQMEGSIAQSPKGANGFGYDPLFIPTGMTQTFAELSLAEKNKISHRSQALKKLLEELHARGLLIVKP